MSHTPELDASGEVYPYDEGTCLVITLTRDNIPEIAASLQTAYARSKSTGVMILRDSTESSLHEGDTIAILRKEGQIPFGVGIDDEYPSRNES